MNVPTQTLSSMRKVITRLQAVNEDLLTTGRAMKARAEKAESYNAGLRADLEVILIHFQIEPDLEEALRIALDHIVDSNKKVADHVADASDMITKIGGTDA